MGNSLSVNGTKTIGAKAYRLGNSLYGSAAVTAAVGFLVRLFS